MENLNEALATLINQATSGIDASVGFLQAEIPDVIVQLLMWHGVRSGIFFVFSILLFLVPIFALRRVTNGFKKFDQNKKKEDYKDNEAISMYRYAEVTKYEHIMNIVRIRETARGTAEPVVAGALSLASVVMGMTHINLTWLQIWIAPKVWLLEYAANLVK